MVSTNSSLKVANKGITLALPAGYSGSEAIPLVVALHWGGPVTPFYSKPFLADFIAPALQAVGAIIVAPDCQHGKWHNPDSEKEVLTLMDTLQGTYKIDSGKIVVTGYSMGGRGTWYLAARNQDRFGAAISMAAPPPPKAGQVQWQIPLYVIHSRSDEHFPIEQTAVVVKALQEQGNDVTFVVLDDVAHGSAGEFTEPLQTAGLWLKKNWMKDIK